ncbi:PucR family transcriptional regulator [Streptomyces sp. BE303]|uniref:PucR family transcriptional regulator n=1 Tax=Streptomyces sp. BE303 TaxID=3002528 RepID=UPI002E7903BE|nr:helix-turn-helix domain-containing protein [Streptomyces sp. BE303]MED7950118.1 helix-turn-helix domain-containing protein [Streptomyces sp. BE303]
MTGHNSPARTTDWRIPVIGGVPADQRLLGAVPELVETVVAALLDRVPAYRRLPREQVTGELVQVTERRIRALAQAVRTGLPAPATEFAAVREAAARRAEEGVPLDAVLLAHHLGLEVCWELAARHARDGDAADLLVLNRLLLDQLRRATAAAGAGYLDERRTGPDERQTARHALLTALLDGAPAVEAARRAGLRLPSAYAVLCLAVADHPDERSPDVDRAVAGHRKLRRLRTELDHATRQSALSALSVTGGVVLVPLEQAPNAVPEAVWQRLADTVDRTARAAGVTVRAGGSAAGPDGVPAAAALADEVLQVARAVGRPPGLHRLDDLLLEYQLCRPSHARGRLAALLAPLEDGGELLATLRVHLSGGLNRRHTAQVLHLHPNTVDYRLRRIAVLTGLDPARPAHLPRITAAIAARDAERDTGHRAVPAGPPGRGDLPSVPDPKDPKDHPQDHQGRQAPPGLLRRSDHSGRSEPAQEPT